MWLDIAVFVGTGILSTLVAQVLIYGGAGDPWTCFLPFFNYFGAALVGLLATSRQRPRRSGRRHIVLAPLPTPTKSAKAHAPNGKSAGGASGPAAAAFAFVTSLVERVASTASPPSAITAGPSLGALGGAAAGGADEHGVGAGADSPGGNTSDEDDRCGPGGGDRGASSAASSSGAASSRSSAPPVLHHGPDPLPWLTEPRFIAASVVLDAVGYLLTVGGIGLAGSALFQVREGRGRARGSRSLTASSPPSPIL